MLDDGRYPDGVKISNNTMKDLERRVIARHGFHGDWNYTILAWSRPAPEPQPEPEPGPAQPAPARRCGQDILNHPALTGMAPADLSALAAKLEVPFRARREQHLYARRKRGRVNAEGAGHNRKIDLTDHVLAYRLRQHLHLPAHVIAALLGVDRTTISHATSLTASLLDRQQPPPAAPPPGTRLRTLGDLRDYAAAAGITLLLPAQPPPEHEQAPTATHPD